MTILGQVVHHQPLPVDQTSSISHVQPRLIGGHFGSHIPDSVRKVTRNDQTPAFLAGSSTSPMILCAWAHTFRSANENANKNTPLARQTDGAIRSSSIQKSTVHAAYIIIYLCTLGATGSIKTNKWISSKILLEVLQIFNPHPWIPNQPWSITIDR